MKLQKITQLLMLTVGMQSFVYGMVDPIDEIITKDIKDNNQSYLNELMTSAFSLFTDKSVQGEKAVDKKEKLMVLQGEPFYVKTVSKSPEHIKALKEIIKFQDEHYSMLNTCETQSGSFDAMKECIAKEKTSVLYNKSLQQVKDTIASLPKNDNVQLKNIWQATKNSFFDLELSSLQRKATDDQWKIERQIDSDKFIKSLQADSAERQSQQNHIAETKTNFFPDENHLMKNKKYILPIQSLNLKQTMLISIAAGIAYTTTLRLFDFADYVCKSAYKKYCAYQEKKKQAQIIATNKN